MGVVAASRTTAQKAVAGIIHYPGNTAVVSQYLADAVRDGARLLDVQALDLEFDPVAPGLR